VERARHRLECDVMGRLAGLEAERRLTGRRDSAGARFDHEFAVDVALPLRSAARTACSMRSRSSPVVQRVRRPAL